MSALAVGNAAAARAFDPWDGQMFALLQFVTILLVAIGLSMSLAHALELPGKMRLSKEIYAAVQPIYYPGFTVGGIFGEFGAMLSTAMLLIATPSDTTSFWLTLAALAALLMMHALYWMLTHPVNKFWLSDFELEGAGGAFFSTGGGKTAEGDWEALRNRWEYSHVARAVLAFAALSLLVCAVIAA